MEAGGRSLVDTGPQLSPTVTAYAEDFLEV